MREALPGGFVQLYRVRVISKPALKPSISSHQLFPFSALSLSIVRDTSRLPLAGRELSFTSSHIILLSQHWYLCPSHPPLPSLDEGTSVRAIAPPEPRKRKIRANLPCAAYHHA